MSDFIPFSRMYDATDRDREDTLAIQASLPSDYTDPADAVGDEAWAGLTRRDAVEGTDAVSDFRYQWDWHLTPAQRASALADVALQREMGSFIGAASEFAAKPPTDPAEFAGRIREMRAERARRL